MRRNRGKNDKIVLKHCCSGLWVVYALKLSKIPRCFGHSYSFMYRVVKMGLKLVERSEIWTIIQQQLVACVSRLVTFLWCTPPPTAHPDKILSMVKTENFSKHNPSPAECSGGETAALFYLEYKFIVKYLQAPPLLTVELSPPLLTDHSDAGTN